MEREARKTDLPSFLSVLITFPSTALCLVHKPLAVPWELGPWHGAHSTLLSTDPHEFLSSSLGLYSNVAFSVKPALPSILLLLLISMPSVCLRLTTQRSGVTRSTDWASQVRPCHLSSMTRPQTHILSPVPDLFISQHGSQPHLHVLLDYCAYCLCPQVQQLLHDNRDVCLFCPLLYWQSLKRDLAYSRCFINTG